MTNFYGEIVLEHKLSITKKLWFKYTLYAIGAFCLTVFDQLSKIWFVKKIDGKPYQSIEIIKNVLNFTYVQNKGASMGILQGQKFLLIGVTLVILGVGGWYVKKHRPEHPVLLTSCALILSGAVGNLIDRVTFGYVRDFIDVQFVDFYVFNVADCAIVIGAILLVVYAFVSMDEGDKKR